MRRLQWILLAAVAVSCALLFWNAVREPYPQASWIAVESPRFAVANGTLPMRVTLAPSAQSGWLETELNGSDSRQRPHGTLSSLPAQWVGTNGGTFLLEFPIPARTNLARVNAQLYLTPTHRWSDRVWNVETSDLRVCDPPSAADDHWKPLHTFAPVEDPEIRPKETSWARWLTAAIWVVFAWRAACIPTSAFGRFSAVLAALGIAFALLECTGADLALAGALRSFARGHQLYEERRIFQQAAIVAGVCIVAAGTSWFIRQLREHHRAPILTAMGLFVLFSLATVFSLHETDRVLALQLGPLPLVQWMKLLGAAGASLAILPLSVSHAACRVTPRAPPRC